MSTALSITDEELLGKLRASPMAEAQKQELIRLFPQMNAEEKGELFEIVDRAEKELSAINTQYKEKVSALDQEYVSEIRELGRESQRNARTEFEKADSLEEAQQLQSVEREIKTIDAVPAGLSSSQRRGSARHTGRTLFLILLFLVLLAGGAYYALRTMNL